MADRSRDSDQSSASSDPLLRAKNIFLRVSDLEGSAQQGAVARECGDDGALRALVMQLVANDHATLGLDAMSGGIRQAIQATIGDRPGTVIGPYTLVSQIGEGGFGSVFLAEQERPVRRQVALKIIKLGMDTRQVVARFEQERQALALMDHPNIAKVFDAGATQSGRPFFVMEFCQGSPITEYCDTHRLPVRQRLELFTQVCSAVQHAHSKGVIHRDIKPTNILVSDKAGLPLAKVIDFGIAKATAAKLTEMTVFTEARQFIGTPEYMSPEQIEGSADIDTRTDVYSLGVLLYELMTGTTPFDAKSLRAAAYAEIHRIIREQDPPRASTRFGSAAPELNAVASLRSADASQLATMIRGDLDWIIMKAMEKDRHRRYETVAGLSLDIRRHLAGQTVSAAPPDAAYRARKFVRRNRVPVIAGTLLAVVLAAGFVGTTLGLLNARRERRLAVQERERADSNAQDALASETRATRQSYAASNMAASTAVESFRFSAARAFLDAAPSRLRGWEWRVLSTQLDTSLRTLEAAKPHGTQQDRLEVSDDGRFFFTVNGLADPLVHQWELPSGRLVRSIPPTHANNATLYNARILKGGAGLITFPMLAFVDPGSIPIASWGPSGEVSVSRTHLKQTPETWRLLLPNSTGDRVTSYAGDRVQTIDIATGEVLTEVRSAQPTQPLVEDSHDTIIVETASTPPFGVVFRDAKSLEVRHFVEGPSYVPFAVFSKDERWLGAGSDDSALVWDLSAHPPTCTALRHPFQVGALQFSPDATLVATTALDRTIRVWDRAKGTLLGLYSSVTLDPYAVMFLSDGETVAGWEMDGKVRFWDTSAERTWVLRGHKDIVSNARFAPGNPAGIIVSTSWEGMGGSTGTVRLWDADSGEAVAVHRGRIGDLVYSMDVSEDGRTAVFGIMDALTANRSTTGNSKGPLARVEFLDLATGRSFSAPDKFFDLKWVAFAKGCDTVVVAESDYLFTPATRLHVLDSRTGRVLNTRKFDPKSSWVFSRSPDGTLIAALPLTRGQITRQADRPNTMLILDAATLEIIREIDGVPERQMCIAFSPDGSRIATGGEDSRLRIFRSDTGELLTTTPNEGMEVLALAFSPDGARIASAGLDRKVRIWDAATFEQVAAFAGHQGHVEDLDWDPTGTRLISCSGDFTIRIWEDAPLRTRVAARDARSRALARTTPVVDALFDRLNEPAKVVQALTADASLSPLDRKAALQLVLRRGLEAPADQPPSPK